MSKPERRNVLVVTLGGAPGVVTETVYALLDRKPAWVPHEIHLVTTAFGANFWQDPNARIHRELKALFAHFRAPPVQPALVVPKTGSGQPIKDLRSEAETVAFANALTWLAMELKERENTWLHMSMAGGRKTMSSYAQAAMQYFAEEADQLTHTLVEPQSLEYHPDFYWPGQAQQQIDVGGNGAQHIVQAASAKIALVPSPFVRLRPHLKRIPFARNNFDHWTLRERMQARLDAYAPAVTLNVADCTVVVDGSTIEFGKQEFALYRLLATAMTGAWPGVGPEGQGANHTGWILIGDFLNPQSDALRAFFDSYKDCFEGAPDETYWGFKGDIEQNLGYRTAAGRDYVANRFKTLRNRVKTKLVDGVASYAARRAVTPVSLSAEPKGYKYGLQLEPHEIEIVPRASRDLRSSSL